jgi:hypothetical protein
MRPSVIVQMCRRKLLRRTHPDPIHEDLYQ